MPSPYTAPTLTGYNPSPAPDTGAAGGASNVVRWSKHTDELTNPLRDYAAAISSAVASAFQGIFGTADVDLIFCQAAAPVGWTQRTSVNDRVLRMVSSAGAGTGGSWTVSGLTHSHTHSAGSYQVAIPEASSHLSGGLSGGVAGTRPVTGTSAVPNASAVSSDGEWRPSYVDVIRCYRNFS